MAKLRKELFDNKYRFRKCRAEGLVACVSCANISGSVKPSILERKHEDIVSCQHPGRARSVQLAESWGSSWGIEEDHATYFDLSLNHVCDAYTSKPLPDGVVVPILSEGQGISLNSQGHLLHVDVNCPYVIEEARLAATGGKTDVKNKPDYMRTGGIEIVDITEIVPGEAHGDACDMPCCESRLQFQIYDPNSYRTRVGIHPNAHDPRYFVRNGVIRHDKKSNMSQEEAEAFFDLTKIVEGKKDDYAAISAVSDHIHKHANGLGSRPLSEAVNPICLGSVFHLLAVPSWLREDSSWQPRYDSTNSGADVWVYDERLFDFRKGLTKPLEQLEQIPEGIIPCMDTKGVFRNVKRVDKSYRCGEEFHVRGILKPLENPTLLAKGLSHFIDIREVSYNAHEHYWGESGIGFSGTESWHEE